MKHEATGSMDRRSFVASALAATVTTMSLTSHAQTYPSRAIQFIAPFSAGGATDLVARRSAQVAGSKIGQPVVVENRTGAAGAIGYAAIARSSPDGYTIGQYGGNLSLVYHTSQVAFNPLADFTYIAGLAVLSIGFAVRADSRFKSFQDVVAAAKERPGTISVAHSGPTTGGHLVCAELERLGIKVLQVPYKGAEWIQALAGGHVDAIAGPLAYGAQLDAGTFRLLATFGNARTAKHPQVPTARELGLSMTVQNPIGVMGPKGMSPRAASMLEEAYRAWTETPDFTRTLSDFQLDSWVRSGSELDAWVREQHERDLSLAQRLGLAVAR